MLERDQHGVKPVALCYRGSGTIRGEGVVKPGESEPAPALARGRSALTIQLSTGTILTVIGLVVAAYLIFRIPHFWMIVLSAVVLATAIDKPVSAMRARGIPRGIGILLIYIVLVGFLVAAIGALAPVVAGDAGALEGELPGYVDRFEELAGSFSAGTEPPFSLTSLEQEARGNVSGLVRGITEVGLEAGRTAFYVFVTLVVAFFLAVEPGVIARLLDRFVPGRHHPRVMRIVSIIHERIGDWARGQLLIAIIFGALMGVGLRLLGVPYAWSLGVVAGILEIVPYVGGAITVVLAIFSAATVGLPQVIGVIVLYVILVNIESHVLAPLLYGRALGLPPVAILLALLAGVELLGVLGALLAVPLTVIAWAIAEEVLPRAPVGMEAGVANVEPRRPGVDVESNEL
jgi:predicted PurR-regulated permease PerM